MIPLTVQNLAHCHFSRNLHEQNERFHGIAGTLSCNNSEAESSPLAECSFVLALFASGPEAATRLASSRHSLCEDRGGTAGVCSTASSLPAPPDAFFHFLSPSNPQELFFLPFAVSSTAGSLFSLPFPLIWNMAARCLLFAFSGLLEGADSDGELSAMRTDAFLGWF
jgi:hypothetical protein